MPALIFGVQDRNRFSLTDPARTVRVMLNHKTGEWFPYDQANVER